MNINVESKNKGGKLYCSAKIKQKFLPVIRVLYADYHAISRFFTTHQSFEISAKMTKNAILTYFRVSLNIKQQYLKSKYFVDITASSLIFKLSLVFSSIRTRVMTKKLKL